MMPKNRLALLGKQKGTRILAVLAVLALLLSAVPSWAEDDYVVDYDMYYTSHARGYVKSTWDELGFDDINLFNGNLTAAIALGPILHAGGDARLQLSLQYNSSIWSDEFRCSGHPAFVDQQYECRYRNLGKGALLGTRYAGLGWSLEVGHISKKISSSLFIITQDGSEHQLFSSRTGGYITARHCTESDAACYTRDGSDIKVVWDETEQEYQAYFPDGLIRHYGEGFWDYAHGSPSDVDYVGRDFARQRDGYYCTRIEDRWGNHIDIDYVWKWYQEAYNQYHEEGGYGAKILGQLIPSSIEEVRADGTVLRTVTFKMEQPEATVGTRARPWRLTSVAFWSPGEPMPFLEYRLDYLSYDGNDAALDRLQLPSYAYFNWGDHNELARKSGWVYLLESVSVVGTDIDYGFRYSTCATDNNGPRDQFVPCHESVDQEDLIDLEEQNATPLALGVLRQVELPTGGTIKYEHKNWYHKQQNIPTELYPPAESGEEYWLINAFWCDSSVSGVKVGDHTSTTLGVQRRLVLDNGDVVLAEKVLEQTSNDKLALPVRFDEGSPEISIDGTSFDSRWNPKIDEPKEPITTPPTPTSDPYYYTSFTRTRVINRHVVDENGTFDPDFGTMVRDDESEYLFSLGATAFDNGDCEIVPPLEKIYILPLSGALIYEQHFRGTGENRVLEQTRAYTYALDDHAYLEDWIQSGPRYGTSTNRRQRETVTYYHGAAFDGTDLVAVTRNAYEIDHCLNSDDPCPFLQPSHGRDHLFASHSTWAGSQSFFDGRAHVTPPVNPFTPVYKILTSQVFAPLDGAHLDTTVDKAYWKDGVTNWLLGRQESSLVSRESVSPGKQETSSAYDLTKGSLTSKRQHAYPGLGSSDEDVLTRYEYVNDPTVDGYGQVQVAQTGFAAVMGAADWTARTPDDCTFFAYENESVSDSWKLCHDPDRCDGWDDLSQAGLPAELEAARDIDPGWRRPTSSIDANEDGTAMILYDQIGRTTYIEPTAHGRLAATILEYPSPSETLVKVELAGQTGARPLQTVARYEYDGLGRLAHVAQRATGTTSLAYDPTEFRHKTFRYDGVGNAWRETDWLNVPDHGTSTNSATVIRTADPFGRPEKTIGSDGSEAYAFYSGPRREETFLVDPTLDYPGILRHRVVERDGRGNTTTVLEDKIIDCTDPAPGSCPDQENTIDYVVSSHDYDVADRMTEVGVSGTDGTQRRSFTYNALGLLLSETHPEHANEPTSYGRFDALGRAGRITHPGNSVFDLFFDAAGRLLTTEVTVAGSGPWLYSETAYGTATTNPDDYPNAIGKPQTVTQYNILTPWASMKDSDGDSVEDSAVAVSHTYYYGHHQGLLSRRDTLIDSLGDDQDDLLRFRLEYDYDLWANLATTAYPRIEEGGCVAAPSPVIDYRWDATGLLGISRYFDETASEDILYDVAYDRATGMMTSWTTAAGTDAGPLSAVYHTTLPDGSLARPKRIQASAGTTLFDTGAYTYDAAGNITALEGSATTPGWSYTYDALNRLRSATRNPGSGDEERREYKHDDFGNIRHRLFEGSSQWVEIPVDPATNRLGGSGYLYDARGNMTQQPISGWYRSLRFDPANRITSISAAGAYAPEDDYAFAYDAAGERVLKYRIADSTVSDATLFLRDETGNVLTEQTWVPTGQSVEGYLTRIKDYVYLGNKAVLRIEQTSTDQGQYESRYTSFVHDHLGSTRTEVAGNGTSPSIEFWPFGEFVTTPGLTETHMFTGHEREFVGTASGVSPLEGLDYMHARYYSQRLGRFLSVDPVRGNPASDVDWNRYSYVNLNPTRFLDPNGQEKKECYFDRDHLDQLIVRAKLNLLAAYDERAKNGGTSDDIGALETRVRVLELYRTLHCQEQTVKADEEFVPNETMVEIYATGKEYVDRTQDGAKKILDNDFPMLPEIPLVPPKYDPAQKINAARKKVAIGQAATETAVNMSLERSDLENKLDRTTHDADELIDPNKLERK